jgi:conjugative relaxase-like TrwC/TraI family protein
MLRIIQNTSAAGAKSYYSTADYYTEGQELAGHWKGAGARRLGLEGRVRQAEWDALCDNRFPDSGEPLTLRRKAERRVGYDFNFHVPKSVSLLYGLTRDERLLEAFRASVDDTMRDMEAEMQTRVRKQGRNEDRMTGNMVWGEFVHFTARPVNGIPDPHLHAHCFVFNTTWDAKEGAWKAGQFSDLKRDAPYFEAKFHSRLSQRLASLGLEIERTRTGWELVGIDASATDKFSRRTAMIEEEARRQGLLDPAAKSELGAKTREHKQKELTLDQLATEWRSRLSDEEWRAVRAVAEKIGGRVWNEDPDASREAMTLAIQHVFERKAVAPEREELTRALRQSVGRSSVSGIESAARGSGLVRAERQGRWMVTTPDVIAEERRMVEFARTGRGSQSRMGMRQQPIRRDWLNAGQKAAVRHVLSSRDRVTLIRGAAGVGKTTMMQEAVEGMTANGHSVFAMAPSAGARDVLRKEGFERAETLARWLEDPKLQQETRGQVLWVDEAGLISSKDMVRLFDAAKAGDNRIVLSGDRRQHGSVERGAALRLLEEDAGLVPAEIREIQRQRGDYKRAVQALADGDTRGGFEQLDRMGWVQEVDAGARYQRMAEDYVDSVASGAETLVVSPTHLEGDRITTAIRQKLRERKLLRGEERVFDALQNTNLTQAERQDLVNFMPGDVLVFHQNAKGHAKGDRLRVGSTPVPTDQAARFQVFHAMPLRLAPGDMLRITKNGKALDGKHRLNNGDLHRVAGFDESGNIRLENGWKVASDYGHLAYGYCVTSHSSQGRSVDRVLIGQSSDSFAASSREQFYVSVSRGKKQATIYTDHRDELLRAIDRSDDRLTTFDLLGDPDKRAKGKAIRRREPQAVASHPARTNDKELIHDR